MNHLLKSWVVLILIAGCASAQAPAPEPSAPPPAPAQPSASGLSPASSLDDILDTLDARGDELKDFNAKVSLATTDDVTGNETTLVGNMWMQRLPDGDARLHVLFDRKVVNDKPREEKMEYLLSKGMLIDRDYGQRVEVQRQVLKPGQKMDLLKLGEGPFPLPLGQDKKDVHEMFEVKKFDPAKDDPAGTIHVQLTPRKDTQFARKFSTIDFWVDPASRMPVKIVTSDPNGTTTRTTTLTNVQVNSGIGDNEFALPPIDEGNWRRHQEAYED